MVSAQYTSRLLANALLPRRFPVINPICLIKQEHDDEICWQAKDRQSHFWAIYWLWLAPKSRQLLQNYQQTLSRFVGPAEVFVSGNTLQLKDYSKTDWPWSMFDPEDKKMRHETVFPEECRAVFEKGANLVR